jgi:hypothetical protein
MEAGSPTCAASRRTSSGRTPGRRAHLGRSAPGPSPSPGTSAADPPLRASCPALTAFFTRLAWLALAAGRAGRRRHRRVHGPPAGTRAGRAHLGRRPGRGAGSRRRRRSSSSWPRTWRRSARAAGAGPGHRREPGRAQRHDRGRTLQLAVVTGQAGELETVLATVAGVGGGEAGFRLSPGCATAGTSWEDARPDRRLEATGGVHRPGLDAASLTGCSRTTTADGSGRPGEPPPITRRPSALDPPTRSGRGPRPP